MNLNGKNATFYLSQGGKTYLSSMIGNNLPVWDLGDTQQGMLSADVEESEDLGVWLRLKREGEAKLFLVRWDFIVGIEFTNDQKGKVIGLRG